MYFDTKNSQWLAVTMDDAMRFGEKLRTEILRHGSFAMIPAGTAMVFTIGYKAFSMFQTLHDIDLDKLLDSRGFIAFEPGSVVMFSEGHIGTFLMRNCRMPTVDEFEFYKQKITV